MIAVFDTETTGLANHPQALVQHQPRIIEFAAVMLCPRTGEEMGAISHIVNPGVDIEPIITKITGLTNDDLRAAQTFAEVAPSIRSFFEQCSGVIAHNLPFDEQMMQSDWHRLGGTWADFPWPSQRLCTVQEYAGQWGKNPKLTDLYQKVLGRPLHQTHRALDDVRALCEIVRHEMLYKDFK